MDRTLKELYYKAQDHGSNTGIEKLFRSAKKAGVQNVTRGRVKQLLSDEQSYYVHKLGRRDFKRNPTYLKGIDGLCRRIWETCRL